MAKTLSSISLDAPDAPVSASVNDTFAFSGTPGFTGSGGVARYDWKWEVDDGGGYVTIAASGTGLVTSGTNPEVNSNSQTQNSITVSCDSVGSYTIRMAGAPSTGGSYTVVSATQTVEVAAGAQNITGALYTDTDTFFAATIGRGAVGITGTLYEDGDTFFAATVNASYPITGALYADDDTFHQAAVAVGAVTISGALYSDDDTFYAASVASGGSTQDITGALYTDTDSFFAATVLAGRLQHRSKACLR